MPASKVRNKAKKKIAADRKRLREQDSSCADPCCPPNAEALAAGRPRPAQVSAPEDGFLVEGGTPSEVLRSDLVAEVFGVAVHVGENPATGRPHLFFRTNPN